MVNNGFIPASVYYNYENYYNMYCDIVNFNLNKKTTYTAALFSADYGKVETQIGDYVNLDIVEVGSNYGEDQRLAKLFTREKLNEIFNNNFSLVIVDPDYLVSLKAVNDTIEYLINNPDKAEEELAAIQFKLNTPTYGLPNPELTKEIVQEILNNMLESTEILYKGEHENVLYGNNGYPVLRQDRGMNTIPILLSLLRLLGNGEKTYKYQYYGTQGLSTPPVVLKRYSLNNYNISAPDNLLSIYVNAKFSNMGLDPTFGSDILNEVIASGEFSDAGMMTLEEMSRIPNSIKSLFLANSQYNGAIEDLVNDPNNPLDDYNMKTRKNFYLVDGNHYNDPIPNSDMSMYKNHHTFPFMVFNYHMPQEIEYLDAYSADTSKKNDIREYSRKSSRI
jgi:hypothetical protein